MPNPTIPPQPPVQPEHKGVAGYVVATVVILAVVVVGLLYFWMNRGAENTDPQSTMQGVNTQQASDEAVDIEADLEATDVENLDAELNAS